MTTEPAIRIGSLNQFQIALYASKDKRLSACDLACLFEIVDRFLKDDGVTRPTGKTHLERETGRSNGSVKESLRRLVEWQYISVAKLGSGTRGTEYLPNFEWAHRVASAIRDEVKDRTEAKKKRRRSGAKNRPTSAPKSVGRNSAPLRELVGQPTALLDGLVGQDSAPQTYVTPTGGDYVGNKSATGTGSGLSAAPARASADRVVRITSSELQTDDNDDSQWLYMKLQDDEGAVEPFAICVHSDEQDVQERGHKRLERLAIALGIDRIVEPDDVVGIPLRITSTDDFLPLEAA